MLERRSILKGLVGLVAAPAIIKIAGIMPVKASLQPEYWRIYKGAVSLRSIAEYVPGDELIDRLDILYGSHRVPLSLDWLNSPGLPERVASAFDEQFPGGAKVGDQLRVRIPNDYIATDGPAISIQDTNEQFYVAALATKRDRWFVDQPASVIPDNLALAAAAVTIAPAILKTPVTRRFWAAP